MCGFVWRVVCVGGCIVGEGGLCVGLCRGVRFHLWQYDGSQTVSAAHMNICSLGKNTFV